MLFPKDQMSFLTYHGVKLNNHVVLIGVHGSIIGNHVAIIVANRSKRVVHKPKITLPPPRLQRGVYGYLFITKRYVILR